MVSTLSSELFLIYSYDEVSFSPTILLLLQKKNILISFSCSFKDSNEFSPSSPSPPRLDGRDPLLFLDNGGGAQYQSPAELYFLSRASSFLRIQFLFLMMPFFSACYGLFLTPALRCRPAPVFTHPRASPLSFLTGPPHFSRGVLLQGLFLIDVGPSPPSPTARRPPFVFFFLHAARRPFNPFRAREVASPFFLRCPPIMRWSGVSTRVNWEMLPTLTFKEVSFFLVLHGPK